MSVINAIKVLNQIADLHIITTVPAWSLDVEAKRFLNASSRSLVFAPSSVLSSKYNFLNRVLSRIKREFMAPIIAVADVKFILEYAKQQGIRIFWIDRVLEHAFSVFRLLRRKTPEAYIIGDTEAVCSRFILRELPFIKSNFVRKALVNCKGKKKELEERELTTSADVVTAVSELDADYFRSIAPDPESIKLFSNIVDLDDYTGDYQPIDSLRCPYVLLLGSFGHVNSPMDRAAKWAVEDIMPLVLQQVPHAHLYIVGRNSDKTLMHYHGGAVSVLGRVHSVLPYLKGARASIVPLHYESGTRFKILETGAASVACVSTTLGAEGIHVTHGENILIADTSRDFAASIVKILQDPKYARSLGNNLFTLIQDKYSLSAQKRDGESIISFLQKK